ncbi:hypothetical protein [Albidovulum sp.]
MSLNDTTGPIARPLGGFAATGTGLLQLIRHAGGALARRREGARNADEAVPSRHEARERGYLADIGMETGF